MRALFVVLPYALMLSASGQGGDRHVGPFDFTATAVTSFRAALVCLPFSRLPRSRASILSW